MSAFDEIKALRDHVNRCILGQEGLVTRLLVALMADGHLLVEGVPGLAKTSAVKALAGGLEGDFHRIQFTPDLLPADLIGTEVFQPGQGTFRFQEGPLFHNFILADEINRSPAKVQSALLEAMAERQVTVGRTTYRLPRLYLVMATQNPIEQEGTYPLPEAQRDRFLLQARVDYPDVADEKRILKLVRDHMKEGLTVADIKGPVVSQAAVLEGRRQVLDLYMAPELEDYVVRLVTASRDPGAFDSDLRHWILYGASPRATIALDLAARAHAWLDGRDYVSPEDLRAMAGDVLRHRILLTYEAEADGIGADRVVERLLATVAVP
jgi:MoxR-like ATPase